MGSERSQQGIVFVITKPPVISTMHSPIPMHVAPSPEEYSPAGLPRYQGRLPRIRCGPLSAPRRANLYDGPLRCASGPF